MSNQTPVFTQEYYTDSGFEFITVLNTLYTVGEERGELRPSRARRFLIQIR
jgi:hypothetical protein